MKKQEASSESKNPTILSPRKTSLQKKMKQDKFNALVLKGKTKTEAGVLVGYSHATARNASEFIEDDESRNRLAKLFEDRKLVEKAADALDRGVVAKKQIVSIVKTESWTKRGKVSKQKAVITEVEDLELQVRTADVIIRATKRDGIGINNYGPTQLIIDL